MGLSTSLGFTGTQHEIKDPQCAAIERVFTDYMVLFGVSALHHGDCVGADAYAHKAFYTLRFYYGCKAPIVVHPPDEIRKRAFIHKRWSDNVLVMEPKPYMTRNEDIVRECDVLVAAPRSRDEMLRSGTWATVRRARSAGKRIVLVYPDGEVEHEGT